MPNRLLLDRYNINKQILNNYGWMRVQKHVKFELLMNHHIVSY